MTALELAAAVRRRELSPVEITEHYLDRIERLNDTVGAFVTVTAEDARASAKQAELAVADAADPAALPPLHGVPVPIKDLDMVQNVRWTWGSAAFEDQIAPLDDDVVTAIRRAGAVLLGKTQAPEFGLPPYTENAVGPPARTPWDLTRSAGGSSGGAAAAVAAGLAPVAQGSDGGGSVRIPASVCGLVGIKPSRGRISSGPIKPDLIGLSTAGPLARTVRDAALLLDAMVIRSPGDMYWAPSADGGFLGCAEREPGRLRIARFATSPVPGGDPHPDVLAAYEAATTLLTDLGHEVEEITPPFGPELIAPFETVWAAMSTLYPVAPDREDRLLPLSRWLRERGQATAVPEYLNACTALQWAMRAAMPLLESYDAVLNPTVSLPPVPLGYFTDGADGAEEFERIKGFAAFTATYNVSGQPAVSLPLFWTDEGLPTGIMLAGRPGDEATLISLSAQLEAARPWHGRRPEVW
ncbi:MAG: amidase [Streptosporangiales bacterium]|nr:amidase [Streptosporangiales bacterium]